MPTYIAAQGHAIGVPGYCWHCDADVACPVHADTSCGACEYACHCETHQFRDPSCRCFPPAKSFRKTFMDDYRNETGATRLEAELAYERYIGQTT